MKDIRNQIFGLSLGGLIVIVVAVWRLSVAWNSATLDRWTTTDMLIWSQRLQIANPSIAVPEPKKGEHDAVTLLAD